MSTAAEQTSLWRKRAMDLDCKLGWIRTELRRATHMDVSSEWKRRALAMLDETEEELTAFLKTVGY